MKAHQPLSEVIASLQKIADIPIYICNYRYEDEGVSRLNYLRYHIEAYFNELYILQDRLGKYPVVLKRAYRSHERSDDIDKACDKLKSLVDGVFEGFKKLRGAHVHEERYDDSDLRRLSLLESLSQSDGGIPKEIEKLFHETFDATCKKWVSVIEENFNAFGDLMDGYFRILGTVLLTDDKLVLPRNIEGAADGCC
jgi:hypothetical protein